MNLLQILRPLQLCAFIPANNWTFVHLSDRELAQYCLQSPDLTKGLIKTSKEIHDIPDMEKLSRDEFAQLFHVPICAMMAIGLNLTTQVEIYELLKDSRCIQLLYHCLDYYWEVVHPEESTKPANDESIH